MQTAQLIQLLSVTKPKDQSSQNRSMSVFKHTKNAANNWDVETCLKTDSDDALQLSEVR